MADTDVDLTVQQTPEERGIPPAPPPAAQPLPSLFPNMGAIVTPPAGATWPGGAPIVPAPSTSAQDAQGAAGGRQDQGYDLKSLGPIIERSQEMQRQALDAYRQQLMRPPPPVPRPQQLPPPPKPGIDPQAASQWLAAAGVMGAISGLGSRRGAMAGLNAFTGTLNGLRAGNQQQYENSVKEWNQKQQQFAQNAKQEWDQYQATIERNDLTSKQAAQMVELQAMQNNNNFMAQVAREAAKRGDLALLAATLDTSGKTMSQYLSAGQKIGEQWEMFKAKEDYKRGEREVPVLSPEAIKVYGETLRTTGRLPAGVATRLTPGDRDAIMNEAARGVTSTEGMLRQQQVFAAALKGDAASLAKITQQYDAVSSFENTALRNMDTLVRMAEKVDSTGMPVFERWSRAGKKATGDRDVAAFDFQYRNTIPEIARILTSPNMTGVLSDSARAEVMDGIPQAGSAAQFRDIFEFAKADFYNRKSSIVEQYNQIRGRMEGGGGLPAPDKPSPPALLQGVPGGGGGERGFTGKTATNPKTGETLRQTTDGQWVP